MVKPVVRRQVDPQVILKFWDAINFVRQQKQIANEDRVQRFMKRNSDLSPGEIGIQLQRAVEDELVLRYTAVGFKGAKVGMEQDGFKIPDPDDSEWERGEYDWYCFDCHQPGEVVKCADCWRVYHPTCTEEDWTGAKFTCSVCQDYETIKKTPRMKRKEVNKLLGYTVIRLKDKTKELHKFGKPEDELKVERMVYKYMDLNTMEEKCAARKYKYLEQFYADARTILHNTFITYGDTGVMADLAKIMIRDCKYDLDEMRQCKDCYHYSNAKPREWFCQPCRPSHELVYAKQKGFSFWPAKVIKVTQEGYDVRFFGGWHQRAIIAEASVKPIHCSMKELGIKRTAGFAKASQELGLHQELVAKAEAAAERGEGEDQEEEEEEMEEPEPEPVPHKKFRKRHREDREEVITSSNTMTDNPAGTPEDANLVTSSEDTHIHAGPRTFSTADIGVQTSKKLSHPGKMPHKSTQTDTEVAATSCNCDSKYNKIFSDFKQRMEDDHKVEQARSLKDLEERLQSEFESDKEQAVTRAMSNLQREVDRAKRQTEDRLREQHAEEIKKLSQKHKAEVSTTKKKQWCYNCEEEAMCHCCWNTSYCSIKCQQDHWHREHKRMCRRKRN